MEKTESFEELRKLALNHVWQPLRPFNVMKAPGGFNIFVEGNGCRLTDINGKTYIDYGSALGNVTNLGYSRKEIADAAYEQMLKLPFRPGHEPNIPQIKLAEKLAEITPGDLSKTFFASSGAEANETAIKIVRRYQQLAGFPNRQKIIVGGYRYHGSTYGAMSLGWHRRVFTWEDYETMLPGVVTVPAPPCFRCELGLKYPDCDIQCARQIERVIEWEVPETIAAFLDVPIATEYCTPPPPEYWPMVRSICDKYGVLLVLDEVMMGFGRTGKWFACEHWDVVPDVITVAKGIAGGYVPLGATITTKKVAQAFEGDYKEMLKHSYTFDGHPVACAAALATLDIMEREKVVENSRVMGEYFVDGLQTLRKHRVVGEIRGGLGLNGLIEFVKDNKTGEEFGADEGKKFIATLKGKMREAGLWGAVANPLLFRPILTSTKEEIDEIVSKMDKVIADTEKEAFSG